MNYKIPLNLPDHTSTQLTVFSDGVSGKAPVLLLFPAMGVEAAYYSPFAETMAEQGMTVITADIRGNGLSSVRPSKKVNFGYREMVEVDYVGIFEEVYRRFPHQKKFVLGHSLGGQLACLFLSHYDFQIDGLILIASCSVHYSGWKGMDRLKVFAVVHFFDLVARALGYFPGDKLGFGGKGARNTLLDWSRQGRSGKYRLRGSDYDYESAMKKLKVPVMSITIENDWLAPYAAMKKLYKKLHPESKIEHIVFTKKDAKDPKLNHFNWGRKPKAIVEKVILWISERL